MLIFVPIGDNLNLDVGRKLLLASKLSVLACESKYSGVEMVQRSQLLETRW
jgi:hypothetical protein